MILFSRIVFESNDGLKLPKNALGEWMMGIWNGIMTSDFSEIPVTVIFNPPSDGLEAWYGTGVTNKDWPKNQRQFTTNIGAVFVVNQTIRSDGKHQIAFRGSGNPKGPMAEAMGELNEVIIKRGRRVSVGRASPARSQKQSPLTIFPRLLLSARIDRTDTIKVENIP